VHRDARRAFDETLAKLGLEQIDLFLIHWPLPTLYDGDYVSTWRTLAEFVDWTRLKRQLEMARQREIDLRDLYAFSRRLAVAFDVSDIHAAIEDHLASVMQRNVVLFPGAREAANNYLLDGIDNPAVAAFAFGAQAEIATFFATATTSSGKMTRARCTMSR